MADEGDDNGPKLGLSCLDVLATMRLTAREYGYALAIHGSLSRDLDVIAVPWIASNVVSPEYLAKEIIAACRGFVPDHQKDPVQKPHGRQSWVFHLFDPLTYVDLSIMPPINE